MKKFALLMMICSCSSIQSYSNVHVPDTQAYEVHSYEIVIHLYSTHTIMLGEVEAEANQDCEHGYKLIENHLTDVSFRCLRVDEVNEPHWRMR